MENYKERKQERIESYKERAKKAREESKSLWNESKEMASVIPFGQPILVGHHSEKSDRNYRDKIRRKTEKSIESIHKAEYYEEKARAAEKNISISSDDPESVKKLKAKITQAEKLQEAMKQANKIIRHKITDEEKVRLLVDRFEWIDGSKAWKLLKPDFCNRVGFPGYELTNNNANIRRMKQRLAELERQAGQETKERKYNGFTVVENVEGNRIQIIFPSKPSEEIRAILKHNGFRWSPRNMAWQRFLNSAGRYAAEYTAEKIKALI
jgi:hypothetical protein